MNSRNDRFEYGLAAPCDSEQILKILESGGFKGKVSVLYTRRPDPIRSLMNEGENAVIPVIKQKESGRICAVGCCIIRKAYINGSVKKIGYLTSLKILPEFRKRLPHISDVYRFLYEQTKDKVDIYYTTILKENTEAQRLLEKRRKSMPEYNYMGEYTVYCFMTGGSHKIHGYTFERGNLKGIDEFYEAQLKNSNFSPVDTKLFGLSRNDFYTLRNGNGDIVAACAVWNQQSYKQYIITGYGGVYRYIKKFPLNIFGYPNLPGENTPANYANIALFMVKDNVPKLAECFIKKVAESARKYNFLMLGLFQNHPLNTVFHKLKHIKYQSRLYTVHWEGEPLEPDNRPINIEVGLL